MNATLYLVCAGVFMVMGLSIGFTLGFIFGVKEERKGKKHERHEPTDNLH